MSLKENLKGSIYRFFNPYIPIDKESFVPTKLQQRIVAKGIDIQSTGVDWWTAKMLLDTLRVDEQLPRVQDKKVWSDLNTLNNAGLIEKKFIEHRSGWRGKLGMIYLPIYHVPQDETP